MKNIKIVADSSADIPADIRGNLGIELVPLVLSCDGKEYIDGVDITPVEVYERSRNGELFTTSQCSVISLKEKFSALVADGSDVIYLAITSKLSGCYSAGCLAKEIVEGDFPGVKIAVIDTMAGSMGHGWAVIRAAMMAKEGYSFEEIVSVVEESRKGLHHYITVDDLSALIRGGRISKGVGLLANTLGIKPIITVIDGAMVPYPKGAKQRGMKKCLARIIEIISEDIVVNEKTKVAVCYAMDTDKSDMFIKLFEERFGRGVDMLTRIGCSIGVHGGHTAFAVFIDDYDAMSV